MSPPMISGDFTRGPSMGDLQSDIGGGDPLKTTLEVGLETPSHDQLRQWVDSLLDAHRQAQDLMNNQTSDFTSKMEDMLSRQTRMMTDDIKNTFDEVINRVSEQLARSTDATADAAIQAIDRIEARKNQINQGLAAEGGPVEGQVGSPSEAMQIRASSAGSQFLPSDVQQRVANDTATSEDVAAASVENARSTTAVHGPSGGLGSAYTNYKIGQALSDVSTSAGTSVKAAIGRSPTLTSFMGGIGVDTSRFTTVAGDAAATAEDATIVSRTAGGLGGILGGAGRAGLSAAIPGGAMLAGGLSAAAVGKEVVNTVQDNWRYQLEELDRNRQTSLGEEGTKQVGDLAAQLSGSLNLTSEATQELANQMANLNMRTKDIPQAMSTAGLAMNQFGLNAQQSAQMTEMYFTDLHSNGIQMLSDLSEMSAAAPLAGVSQGSLISSQAQLASTAGGAFGYTGTRGLAGGEELSLLGFGPGAGDTSIPGVSTDEVQGMYSSLADPTNLIMAAGQSRIPFGQAVGGLMSGSPGMAQRLVQGRMRAFGRLLEGRTPQQQYMMAQTVAGSFGMSPGMALSMVQQANAQGLSVNDFMTRIQRRSEEQARKVRRRSMRPLDTDRVGGELAAFASGSRGSLFGQVTGRLGLNSEQARLVDSGELGSELGNLDDILGGDGLSAPVLAAAAAQSGVRGTGADNDLSGADIKIGGQWVSLEEVQQLQQEYQHSDQAHRSRALRNRFGKRIAGILQSDDLNQQIQAVSTYGRIDEEGHGVRDSRKIIRRRDLTAIGPGPVNDSNTGGSSVQAGDVGISLRGDAAEMFSLMVMRGNDSLNNKFGDSNLSAENSRLNGGG